MASVSGANLTASSQEKNDGKPSHSKLSAASQNLSGALVKAASSRRTPRRRRDACIIPNSAFLIPNYLKQVFQAFLLLGFHVGLHLFLLFDNRAEFFDRFVEVFHLEHFRQDGVELNDDGFKLGSSGGL